jgi:hypothetical protein
MPIQSPDPTDLTDVASVEQFLALPSGNADEGLLQSLVTAVSAEIVTYCERGFMSQSYAEVRNGNGQDAMNFFNPPCTSVGSLAINTVAIQPSPDALSSGYSFDSERIYVRGLPGSGPSSAFNFGRLVFGPGFQNVTIVYTAGYFTPGQKAIGQSQPSGVALLPADLKMAATELVALRYRQSKRWGDTGFGVGTERVNYFVGEMPAATRLKLDRYRRVTPIEP